MKEYVEKILKVTNKELDDISLEKYLKYVNIVGRWFDGSFL